MLIQMEVATFALDPTRNAPLIVLKESGGDRTLSLPIGHADASIIAIKSLNVVTDKPLTIDLVKTFLDVLGGRLHRVVIDDAMNQGLATRLHVHLGKAVHLIDCSTSDGISLSLRCSAPIFVTEAVFQKHKNDDLPSPQEALRRSISSTDTLEFGTYHLE